MRKSWGALSILGLFAGTAAAQSSVTLFGKVDIGYGQLNGGTYEGGSNKVQQLSNALYTSRWGLRGSEDLGGGVKANFMLMQGFNSESGAASTNGSYDASGSKSTASGFDRAAWVGLSGSFGEVRAGRQDSAGSAVLGVYDQTGAPVMGSASTEAGVSGITDRVLGSRRNSQLTYFSPSLGGLSATASYASKNDLGGSLPASDVKDLYVLGATYKLDRFSVGAAYESKPWSGSGVAGAWGVGAKYDFGVVLLSASYFDNHRQADGRGFLAGISAPIGAFTIGTQVGYSTDARDAFRNSASTDKKIKPLVNEVFARYAFSKSTYAYLQYAHLNGDAETFQNALGKNSWALGIDYSF